MAISRWVYRLSDGQYLYGGFYDPSFDSAQHGVDLFLDASPHPDLRLQRGPGRRAATPAEIAIYDAGLADTTAQTDQALKAIKATVVWILRRLLGRNPTLAEIQTARDEWIAIWKALP